MSQCVRAYVRVQCWGLFLRKSADGSRGSVWFHHAVFLPALFTLKCLWWVWVCVCVRVCVCSGALTSPNSGAQRANKSLQGTTHIVSSVSFPSVSLFFTSSTHPEGSQWQIQSNASSRRRQEYHTLCLFLLYPPSFL